MGAGTAPLSQRRPTLWELGAAAAPAGKGAHPVAHRPLPWRTEATPATVPSSGTDACSMGVCRHKPGPVSTEGDLAPPSVTSHSGDRG